ncbi:tetratricopeptide repeat protein [Mucilaginibacter sp. HD30]
MKYFFAFILALTALASFAQNISYADFKKQAKEDINLCPEYGNVRKTEEQVKADQDFVKLVLQQDGTNRKGSEHMVKLGFDYLYKGDLVTAIKRFNQAWLLDNKNENAYWGFSAVYFSFNDYTEALAQLDKGLIINPNSSNILTDKATIYTGYYANTQKMDDLNKAIDLFNKSYSIDPRNQNTLFKLSVAYFYKKDCVNALKYYDEHNKIGGNAIPDGYAAALKQLCNK